MEAVEVVIRAGGDELLSIPFSAGDRTPRTEQRLRLIGWIVNAVTREEPRKRSSRTVEATPGGERTTPPSAAPNVERES